MWDILVRPWPYRSYCFVNKTTLTIICHYSVCVIYDLSRAGRSTVKLLIIEHQPVNYKLCFLSEEKLFS